MPHEARYLGEDSVYTVTDGYSQVVLWLSLAVQLTGE